MKKTNKIMSVLISIMMIMGMLPQMAFANEIRPEGLEWDEEEGIAYFTPLEKIEVYLVKLYRNSELIDQNTYEDYWEYIAEEDAIGTSFSETIEKYGEGKYSFFVQACKESYDEYADELEWDMERLTPKYYQSFESPGFSYSPPDTVLETPAIQEFKDTTISWTNPNTTYNQNEMYTIITFYADYGNGIKKVVYSHHDYSGNTSCDITNAKAQYERVINNLHSIDSKKYNKNKAVFKAAITACSRNIVKVRSSSESAMQTYATAASGGSGGSGGSGTEVDPDPPSTSNSGTCGEYATWTLSDDGVLTISGKGEVIADDESYLNRDFREKIKKVVVEDGITALGDDALYEIYNLTEISLPSTLKKIGSGFVKGSLVKNVIIPKSVTYINMDWSFIKCSELDTVTFLNDNIQLYAPDDALLADGYTIRANFGSNAYKYARDKGIAFEALPSESAKVTINVVDSQTLLPISGASIELYDSVFSASASSDTEGKAILAADNGLWKVTANAVGYPTRTANFEITDTAREFTVYMSKNSILNVTASAPKEMTKDEIIKAGIDINAVENKHVYNCVTVLQFTPSISVNVPCIFADDQLIKGEPVKVKIPTADAKGTYDEATIYPVAKDVFLIIHSTTSWLKEMFDVQLLVSNSSAVEVIEDCIAELNLPDGLSLAVMTGDAQSETVDFGDVAPNEIKDHHWYICGDKEGEYILDGTVSGTRVGGGMSGEISANFTTSEPITVLAGNAMKMTITAEGTATVGETYKVKYALENTSEKTLYDVLFRVLRGKFIEAYDISEITCKPEIFGKEAFEGDIENGFELSAPEFEPGAEISGIFEITFGEGLDLTNGMEYILKEMFVFTGEGSTTIIPTEVEFVDSLDEHSYGTGTVKKPATCTEDGIMEYACTTCPETKTEVIPAMGHSYGEWYVSKESTCIERGEMRRDCTRAGCDEKETKPLSLADHKWDDGTVTKAPTLEETGTKTYSCTVDGCDGSREEEIPKLILQEITFATGDVALKYGDAPAIYNKANNDSPNGGEITYSSSDETVATVDNTGKVTILKAGETTITATAAQKGIYGQTSVSYKLTINKAPLTVKADDMSIFYAQDTKPFTFTATGFVNKETASVLTGEITYNTNYEKGKPVGEYTISVAGLTSDNYDITFADGKLTVKKAIDYKITLTNLNHKVGEVTAPQTALEPADDTAVITVEYRLADGTWTTEMPTEAGDYPIRAYLAESDNISTSGKKDDTTGTFVVKPAALASINGSGDGIDVTINEKNVEFSITDEAAANIVNTIPQTGEVIIDATGSTDGVNNITLPSNIVQAVNDAEAARTFTVSGDDAEIRMDKGVVNSVASQMGEEDKLEMHIEAVEKSSLTEAQQTALNSIAADAVALQLNMTVVKPDETREALHELGGNVSVKAAYTLPENMRSKKIVVCYVSDDGAITYMRAIYSDGFIYFTTDHFSVYAMAVVDCEHEWDAGTVIEPATTTQTGIKHFVCTVCGETKDEIIPKRTVSSGGGGGSSSNEYTVSFVNNEKTTSVKVQKNSTLEKPQDPTLDGYTFDGWYTDKEYTKAYDFSEKVTKSFKLYAKWTEKSEESAAIDAFTDVDKSLWYYDAIKFVIEKGIANGVTDTTFEPDSKVTRAQFIAMLCRAYGIEEMTGDNFADADNAWYTGYLAAAKQLGISEGVGDNMFAPEKKITREEMVTLMYNYLTSSGKITETEAEIEFADSDAVSDWATTAVAYLSSVGYINGKDNNMFDPKGNATRAELAQIFFNIFKAE